MIATDLFRQRSSSNKVAAVVGLTAIAGIALVCAIPKARRACSSLLDDVVDFAKARIGKNNGNARDWERDLASAEKLKGPVSKRKDTSAIKAPNASTTAWKDEWSSE
ncbi:MAG: hypothetical protein EOP00_19675 [Pedobacter sp.]|nr:MAG: hypothetical protein EOP00_19675 [Pedobacter sp.]